MMKTPLSCMYLFVLLSFPFAHEVVRAEPVVCQLAKEGIPLVKITVSENVSQATLALSKELATYLSLISGANFETETGTGDSGIVLGLPEDFTALPFPLAFESSPFGREQYLLRSSEKGLYLLGATDMAVSHAVWDLLYRLGYRQFFPGETWEVVPEIADLKIAIDEFNEPDFYARRIWYNWGLWGYNEIPYRDWCRRNRATQGFQLNSGHSYDGIMAENREEFEKHPEYFALIDGKRSTSWSDQKFCTSNPNLRKLIVDHVIRSFKRNPYIDSVSLDPSDGGGWCQCENCTQLGNPATRIVLLATESLEALEELGQQDKVIGFYAYNQHAQPPSIPIPKGAIPSVTTAFLPSGMSFEQILEAWQAKGAKQIGTYDYLSVVVWDWNMPKAGNGSQIARLAKFLPDIHKKGVRFYDAESGDCWGPCGLGYYFVSKVLWDIEEAKNVERITEDFLEKCFGTAKEPMREFYRLINFDDQRRPIVDLVGRMYRQIDAAKKLTTDAKILKRLDDLTLYTRHVELYSHYSLQDGNKDDVVRHVYRMRTTMMVHSYGFLCRFIGQGATLDRNNSLFDNTPYSAKEIAVFLEEGIKNNAPVDPGFESIAFSKKLVPAAERLKLPEVPQGYFPTDSQDRQVFQVYLSDENKEINFKITVEPLWKNGSTKISMHSSREVTGQTPVAENEDYHADGKEYAITLKSPFGGLHEIVTVDGGDYTRIAWGEGVPVSVESGIDSPHTQTHFRGNWTLYFYVPKGTKHVGGWAARVASWAPRTMGKLLDPEGNVQYDFGEHEEGWFCVDVPEGMDGQLWKFQDNNGQRLLMTVPPYLARSGKELLLPEEVIDKEGSAENEKSH